MSAVERRSDGKRQNKKQIFKQRLKKICYDFENTPIWE